MLTDAELMRYNRQILMPQWDIAAQEKIRAARVLIVGMGGLGCPVSLYLASAGVGELWLADFDTVEESNLQRQVLFREEDIGCPKAEAAARQLAKVNPHVTLKPLVRALDADSLPALLADVDLVLDCTDNFSTRDAVNRACVMAGKPLVSAAAIGMSGQLSVFHGQGDRPCYRCLYPEGDAGSATCSESGVLATVVGVMGTLQAHEALKCLSGVGVPLFGKLVVWEGESSMWRTLAFRRDPACSVCGNPEVSKS
ncbi:adenylyltransferase/sulfurtransferase [Fluviicoccus keumensis]|uniref:Molybdopterin-synthase adenylyltransferase n=1 Tax=Fluviicoccus keumensis TaxID=1435465 RepID=A0A4Q7ZAN9_9GAMM|nr:molybdopterin-synthase adenylyltransferase MoeB [Fluviicoccus keumensis]RZU47194.1 adenylyltransferase/sulfurtransferase [Fluviicoccus keumensis]